MANVPWKTKTVFASAALVGKLFTQFLTKNVVVRDAHRLVDAVFNRAPGRPLITISNHTSPVDDPLIWTAIFNPVQLARLCLGGSSQHKRWVLGAEEICFTNPLYNAFMHTGRVIPIRRGEGIYQPAVEFALSRLALGDWVHVFVEGKIGSTPGQLHKPIRWGVARLIMECVPPPIVVPIVHLGLERVVGMGKWIPRRADVDLRIGPLIDGGLMQQRVPEGDATIIRAAMGKYLEDRLHELYELDNPTIQWFMHEHINT